MTGFMNQDGSELVGGIAPSGAGQALQVDNAGNLKITAAGGAGSVVNVADPNTPANKMAVDAAGKIGINSLPSADISDRIARLLGHVIVDSFGSGVDVTDRTARLLGAVNISQLNGTAPGASNPFPTANYIGSSLASLSNPYPSADQVRLWVQNGQVFSGNTNKQSAGGAFQTGASLFNPAASGKTLVICSIRVGSGNSAFHHLYFTTTDPALGTSLPIANHKPGGAASVASGSFANASTTFTGNPCITQQVNGNTFTDFLINGDAIFLSPGNGVEVSITTSTNNWATVFLWAEV